ncbi:unnamed protein product [Nezara viridula]|uniref:Phosphatidic acid phosphatase type 2/haloperoxidase domain-containing protein n=2 Tax=Nezara viridula TaxID=85310 RepID=A0A9P0EBD9_NEZVI|nr:unnamed protein product [Nezara viridula]
MDLDSKEIYKRVITDFLCVFAVGFPILIFRLFGVPYKRGFYCDDLSIRYPFHPSTVPDYALYIVGIGLPISVILIFEVSLLKKFNSKRRSLFLFGWKVPPWLIRCYKEIGYFCFGAVCSQLITDIGKYSIGRLRPHFMTVCDPDVDCSMPDFKYKYFVEFTCKGTSPKLLRESRLSFPSGHSSFSAYTMVYLALYLQAKLNWRGSYLLKHFLQFCCVALSWATALSRVSDYKHHWSDVLVGLLIGTTVAFLNANFVSDLFGSSSLKKKLSETTTLTNTSHQVMLVTNNSSADL